jgi:hypothetical protein
VEKKGDELKLRLKQVRKSRRLGMYLRETRVVQFAERLHFVTLKGLKSDFLETSSKKTTRPIPFFSDASEFFPEPIDILQLETLTESAIEVKRSESPEPLLFSGDEIPQR